MRVRDWDAAREALLDRHDRIAEMEHHRALRRQALRVGIWVAIIALAAIPILFLAMELYFNLTGGVCG